MGDGETGSDDVLTFTQFIYISVNEKWFYKKHSALVKRCLGKPTFNFKGSVYNNSKCNAQIPKIFRYFMKSLFTIIVSAMLKFLKYLGILWNLCSLPPGQPFLSAFKKRAKITNYIKMWSLPQM